MKAIIAMLFLAVFTASAAETFSMDIESISGSRALVKDDYIQITNCDSTDKPQYIRVLFDMTYPRGSCEDDMDIYYSYYDFPTGQYTDEGLLCVASETDNCEAMIYVLFGGEGTDTAAVDEWIRFRAVCRKNGNEFTYNMPVTFKHSPSNVETAIAQRLTSCQEEVAGAESAVSACKCCSKYSAELSTIKSDLVVYETNLSRCQLLGLDNNIIQLVQRAQSLTAKAEAEQCPSEVEETVDETVEGAEEIIENVTEGVDDLIDTPPEDENDGKPESQPAASACPMGALLLVVAGALAFASKN